MNFSPLSNTGFFSLLESLGATNFSFSCVMKSPLDMVLEACSCTFGFFVLFSAFHYFSVFVRVPRTVYIPNRTDWCWSSPSNIFLSFAVGNLLTLLQPPFSKRLRCALHLSCFKLPLRPDLSSETRVRQRLVVRFCHIVLLKVSTYKLLIPSPCMLYRQTRTGTPALQHLLARKTAGSVEYSRFLRTEDPVCSKLRRHFLYSL